MYEIIYHDRIKTVLEQEFSKVSDNLQIISAYCKTAALAYVDSKVSSAPVTKRLMVRFRLDDILSGATDLDIYIYCKQYGWDLYILLDLHAKTFIFDRKRWIVGSANLTSRGIGLAKESNLEMAMLAEVDPDELVMINAMFDKSTLMTDNLYERMKKQVECVNNGHLSMNEWDDDIVNMIRDDITTLFTHDFPKTKTPFEINADDYLMLGLTVGDHDKSEIVRALQSSRGFKWLMSTLRASNNQQLYFGELTAKLHDALINDPKPYRKEVKQLLANLLNWISLLGFDNIKIERPNYSQVVRLL
ncbi:hypothetical protein UNSWDHB_305 [Dehalobacter sp. UNSWDHB]|jgi:hypothetical protein|uniref:phospholipase D-like domain-containing protein n=1 Tax=unclassified Dehalobacter TaxID=2635733 RepID=UPI00028A9B53|nr:MULTISPECIES: phospholipase D-like domain-containing protein [unclassified Dehalobacter]AFV03477.1 hypothetical protein DHBDCA_p2450 [Dehalobacter sp. DCA]AFV06464.1 hypothetical protein DCF50_p2461 [Dehalobacter sp. CF]EQB22352.1 hypothetical protein UNSWDHB_305 [Dehalobacter sp. UNSWDHB]